VWIKPFIAWPAAYERLHQQLFFCKYISSSFAERTYRENKCEKQTQYRQTIASYANNLFSDTTIVN